MCWKVKNQAAQFMRVSKDNYKEAITEAEQDSALRTGRSVWKLSFVTDYCCCRRAS